MEGQLQEFQQQVQEIKRDGAQLTAGLNPYALNWHPAPGRWSIAECLDHLTVAGSRLLPRIDEAMRTARDQNITGPGPYSYGMLGSLFVWSQKPPIRRRLKTSRQYLPLPGRRSDTVTREFAELQDRLSERIAAADGLDLKRIKVRSPVSRWLQFNIAVWFAATIAHERRHLWQARQVIESPEFPAHS